MRTALETGAFARFKARFFERDPVSFPDVSLDAERRPDPS